MSHSLTYVLRVVAGTAARRRFPLEPGRYRVGSSRENEIRLEEAGVSRRHAELEVLPDGGVILADLESKNGTYADGRRVSRVALSAGAELGFGGARAVLELVDSSLMAVVLGGQPGESPAAARAVPATVRSEEGGSTEGAGPAERFLLLLRRLFELQAAGASVGDGAALLARDAFSHLAGRRLEVRRQMADGTEVAVAAAGSGGSSHFQRISSDGWSLLLAGGPDACLERVRPQAELALAFLAGWARQGSLIPPPAARLARLEPAQGATASLNPAVQTLYRRAAQVARGDVPVLILGASGTGKEVLARFVHTSSRRKDRPFLALNCAALPRELLEAELFGIEKGVATGVEERAGLLEQARGGTVFLDEIGDMPAETQAKLLRALESTSLLRVGGRKPIPLDVRFLAATHHDLEEQVAAGRFRLDLYHRLAAFVARLPTLAERREDLPGLVATFFHRELAANGLASPGVTGAALSALAAYGWPGNIRELENEIKKAVLLLEPGEPLDVLQLSPRIQQQLAPGELPLSLEATVRRAEQEAFRAALAAAQGSAARAMELLGISKTTYYRKLAELGLG